MEEATIGKVVRIAVRSAPRGPMRELAEAHAIEGGGLDADIPVRAERGITFLSQEQWAEVRQELGVNLPWHTRRANVLTEGLKLAELIGRRLRFGSVEVLVEGETKPCQLMDQLQPGLLQALVPGCRGGVFSRVIRGGTFRVGDPIIVVSAGVPERL